MKSTPPADVVGGTLRHFRLADVPATLAPFVSMELTHGTVRGVYLQQVCALVARITTPPYATIPLLTQREATLPN